MYKPFQGLFKRMFMTACSKFDEVRISSLEEDNRVLQRKLDELYIKRTGKNALRINSDIEYCKHRIHLNQVELSRIRSRY